MAIQTWGTTDYLYSATAPVTTWPFTLTVLANFTNFAASRICVSLCKSSETGTNLYTLGGNSSSKAVNTTADGAGTAITSSASMVVDTWYGLTLVVRSATDRELYVNGTSVATSAVSRTPAGINALYIGVRGGAVIGLPMLGHLAHVGIWNVDIGASYIALLNTAALHRSPAFVRRDALVAHYRLEHLSNYTVDTSNGYPLTVIGPVTPLTQAHVTHFPEPQQTFTAAKYKEAAGLIRHEYQWVSDHTGTAYLWLDGSTYGGLAGIVDRLITEPSPVSAPTANYDVSLVDGLGNDIIGGLGANRSATLAEVAHVYSSLGSSAHYADIAAVGPVQLRIDNCGNYKAGTVALITRPIQKAAA